LGEKKWENAPKEKCPNESRRFYRPHINDNTNKQHKLALFSHCEAWFCWLFSLFCLAFLASVHSEKNH